MGIDAERLSQPGRGRTDGNTTQQPKPSVWDTPVFRRTVLKWGYRFAKGVVATAAVAKAGEVALDIAKAIDVASGEENWPQTATRLLRLDECNEWFSLDKPQTYPKEAFITIGGLGCVSSWPHAQPMGIAGLGLPEEKTIPMSYLVTSNQGKTPEDVATITRRESEKSEALSFYGHSNGGPTILEALHVLKQQKENGEPNGKIIPVKRLILNCSPFDFDDAKENFFAKGLAKIANIVDYPGGVYSKFLYQLWERLQAKGGPFIDRLRQGIGEAWDEAKNGDSPTPWLSDLYNLYNARLDEYDFEGILTPETEILYLKSLDDSVVHNDQAIEKYRQLAGKYGAKFTVREMDPGVKHADSQEGGKVAHEWILQTTPSGHTPV